MRKIEPIEYFIPARALEHSANSEDATLRDKLRFAALRYFQNKDFFLPIQVEDPLPFVLLEKVVFNKDQLGYNISGEVRCG